MARKSSSSSSSSPKVRNKKESICEKSIVLVANIIKLSSLAFVRMNCGTQTTPRQKKNYENSNSLSSYSSAKDAYHDRDLDEANEVLILGGGGHRRGHMSKKQPLLSVSDGHGVSYVMVPPVKHSPPKQEFKNLSTVESMFEDFLERKRTEFQRQKQQH